MNPTLRELRDEGYDLLREFCAGAVRAPVDWGEAAPGLDVGLEAERLYALVDGLALHAVVKPERAPAGRISAVLARHLDALCGEV